MLNIKPNQFQREASIEEPCSGKNVSEQLQKKRCISVKGVTVWNSFNLIKITNSPVVYKKSVKYSVLKILDCGVAEDILGLVTHSNRIKKDIYCCILLTVYYFCTNGENLKCFRFSCLCSFSSMTFFQVLKAKYYGKSTS